LQANKKNKRQIIQKLIDIDLLIIDDMGKEVVSNWVKQIVFQVINGRYVNQKPTIYTMNEGANELIEKYGKATVDRIAGSSIIIKAKDIKSYRQENI
jgi:DNA replication protein DnaC